jgi:hypothetical protein
MHTSDQSNPIHQALRSWRIGTRALNSPTEEQEDREKEKAWWNGPAKNTGGHLTNGKYRYRGGRDKRRRTSEGATPWRNEFYMDITRGGRDQWQTL